MHRTVAVAMLSAALWRGPQAFAQQAAQRTVVGHVRSVGAGPVVGAEVTIVGMSRSTTTDTVGAYRLRGAPMTAFAIIVRRPGFQPKSIAVPEAADTTAVVDVELVAGPTILPDLRVKGSKYAWTADFERRRLSGFGTFLGPEELAAKGAMHTVELLRGIPGVRTTLDAPGHPGEPMVLLSRCKESVTVWLDGEKLRPIGDGERKYSSEGKATPLGVGEMLSRINPYEIAAIEIYRGVGELPAEFMNDGCAAIAMWTK